METVAYDEGEALEVGKIKELEAGINSDVVDKPRKSPCCPDSMFHCQCFLDTLRRFGHLAKERDKR